MCQCQSNHKQFDVKIKLLHPDAIVPKYETSGAAGFDIRAFLEEEACISLQPGERKLINTKLTFAVPLGYELQLRPRSGLALKYGITLTNSPATIDSDYRGEVKILLQNTGDQPFVINHQDRIAQGVFAPVKQGNFVPVNDLDETERGAGGFGHTGQN